MTTPDIRQNPYEHLTNLTQNQYASTSVLPTSYPPKDHLRLTLRNYMSHQVQVAEQEKYISQFTQTRLNTISLKKSKIVKSQTELKTTGHNVNLSPLKSAFSKYPTIAIPVSKQNRDKTYNKLLKLLQQVVQILGENLE